MAIPNRFSLSFTLPESSCFQMESVTENLEKSMKNSSAPTAPTSVAAAISSEHPAPAPASGLTTRDITIARGGTETNDDGQSSFTLVTRSKRGRAPTVQKEAPETLFPPPPETPSFKDPFGLARVSQRVNLVSMARTKQVYLFLTLAQATVGDVEGSQPWAVQMEARAKWDAWNSVKGMSKEDAMKQYMAIVAKGDPNWKVSCYGLPDPYPAL